MSSPRVFAIYAQVTLGHLLDCKARGGGEALFHEPRTKFGVVEEALDGSDAAVAVGGVHE